MEARRYTRAVEPTHDPQLGLIFPPPTKMALIEDGGIGTIRLRPRRIDNTDCWLSTASKQGQCAGAIPLALPDLFLQESRVAWGDEVTIYGKVRFLQDAGLDDTAAYVHHASPLIVFVEKIEGIPTHREQTEDITISPVVLFDTTSHDALAVRQWGSGKSYGYTFVYCEPQSGHELNTAAEWLETYAAKFDGRIITNFDERSPLLADAPLSYQRLVRKDYERVIIEHLYFNGEKLADRIDRVVSEYVNYGQVARLGSEIHAEKVMSEQSKYTILGGSQGAVGDNSRSDNNLFVQAGLSKPVDLAELAKQLSQVRKEMTERADPNKPEQYVEIGVIAQAEKAAELKDGSKVLGLLKSAGTWTAEVAKSVAAGLVKDAVEGKL